MLAGLINSPIRRNPFYYPERAKARRNVVLKMMRENGKISQERIWRTPAASVEGHARSRRNRAMRRISSTW